MSLTGYPFDGCLIRCRVARQQAGVALAQARACVEALQRQSAALQAEIRDCEAAWAGPGGIQASARRFVTERWQAWRQCQSLLAEAEGRLVEASGAAFDAHRQQRRFEMHRDRFLAQAHWRKCLAGYRCQDDAALEIWRRKGGSR